MRTKTTYAVGAGHWPAMPTPSRSICWPTTPGELPRIAQLRAVLTARPTFAS